MSQYSYLCSTCRYAGECTVDDQSDKPVCYHTDYKIISFKPSKQSISSGLDVAGKESDALSPMGLCVTCEINRTCGKTATPGGIWACKEYR